MSYTVALATGLATDICSLRAFLAAIRALIVAEVFGVITGRGFQCFVIQMKGAHPNFWWLHALATAVVAAWDVRASARRLPQASDVTVELTQ